MTSHDNATLIEIHCPRICGRMFLVDETQNPTGSLKGRVAAYMINRAEQRGLLSSGHTIVDCTSGNNGIAIAYESMLRGYKCITVVSQDIDESKAMQMRKFGASVVMVKTPPGIDATSLMVLLRAEAESIRRGRQDVHFLNQADNPDNADAYSELGESIASQINHIRLFVGIVGTGGSLCGIGRSVCKLQPTCEVVAACSDGETLFDHRKLTLLNLVRLFRPSPLVPKNIDYSTISFHRTVTLKQAVATCRVLNRHGIAIGLLSSSALYAALVLLHECPTNNGAAVSILGDSNKYVCETVCDDAWVKRVGLLDLDIEDRLEYWTDLDA